jgi:hypothetical protein
VNLKFSLIYHGFSQNLFSSKTLLNTLELLYHLIMRMKISLFVYLLRPVMANPSAVLPKFFENVGLVMTYSRGLPRLKKGWPPLV